MNAFPESKEALQQMYTLLNCVKCKNLPKDKIWSLVTCQHKYCEDCFNQLNKGDLKTCLICDNFEYAEDIINHDSFATDLLRGLRLFEACLNKEQAPPPEPDVVIVNPNVTDMEVDNGTDGTVYYDAEDEKDKSKSKVTATATEIEDMFGDSDTETGPQRGYYREPDSDQDLFVSPCKSFTDSPPPKLTPHNDDGSTTKCEESKVKSSLEMDVSKSPKTPSILSRGRLSRAKVAVCIQSEKTGPEQEGDGTNINTSPSQSLLCSQTPPPKLSRGHSENRSTTPGETDSGFAGRGSQFLRSRSPSPLFPVSSVSTPCSGLSAEKFRKVVVSDPRFEAPVPVASEKSNRGTSIAKPIEDSYTASEDEFPPSPVSVQRNGKSTSTSTALKPNLDSNSPTKLVKIKFQSPQKKPKPVHGGNNIASKAVDFEDSCTASEDEFPNIRTLARKKGRTIPIPRKSKLESDSEDELPIPSPSVQIQKNRKHEVAKPVSKDKPLESPKPNLGNKSKHFELGVDKPGTASEAVVVKWAGQKPKPNADSEPATVTTKEKTQPVRKQEQITPTSKLGNSLNLSSDSDSSSEDELPDIDIESSEDELPVRIQKKAKPPVAMPMPALKPKLVFKPKAESETPVPDPQAKAKRVETVTSKKLKIEKTPTPKAFNNSATASDTDEKKPSAPVKKIQNKTPAPAKPKVTATLFSNTGRPGSLLRKPITERVQTPGATAFSIFKSKNLTAIPIDFEDCKEEEEASEQPSPPKEKPLPAPIKPKAAAKQETMLVNDGQVAGPSSRLPRQAKNKPLPGTPASPRPIATVGQRKRVPSTKVNVNGTPTKRTHEPVRSSPRSQLKRAITGAAETTAKHKRPRKSSVSVSAESSPSEAPAPSIVPSKVSVASAKSKQRGAGLEATPSSTFSARSSRRAFDTGSPANIEKRNHKGETQLHLAAKVGNSDKVKQLIEMGADLNAQDFAEWTPLHEAICGKKSGLQISKLLLEAGCHVNKLGLDGETALHGAVRLGHADIVALLLSYSASPNIRNKFGQLPKDVAKTKSIVKLLETFKGPILRKTLEEDDPTFSNNSLEKALLFFTYALDENVMDDLKEEFKANIAKELSSEVTHIIFESKSRAPRVPLTENYLFGVLSGIWLLSSKWITESLLQKKLLGPEAYEVAGTDSDPPRKSNAPKRARLNKELGNPGLLHGLCFYVYKNSLFGSLKKKALWSCIRAGGGTVLIREPNPDQVDPLEYPVRFHGSDPSSKFVLTSHLILWSEGNEPAVKHRLEHVKTLTVDWLIHSALTFELADPDKYLQNPA